MTDVVFFRGHCMAFIYRYQIKDSMKRKITDLRQNGHDLNIEKAIRDQFKSRVKAVDVQNDYFEFRLYSVAENVELREMGKKIVQYDQGLNELKKKTILNTELFQRRHDPFFGFLEHVEVIDGEKDRVYRLYFDMVDAIDINKMVEIDFIYEFLGEKVKVLKEMDTYQLVVSISKAYPIVGSKTKNIPLNRWYQINGKTTLKEKDGMISLDYMSLNPVGDLNFTESQTQTFYEVSSIKNNKFKQEQITKLFNLREATLDHDNRIKGQDNLTVQSVVVYNVGQGLCSAVCDDTATPCVYFDFGRGERADRITDPNTIKYEFKNNPPVILSHWHTDHWIGIKYDLRVLNSFWIVPNQKKGAGATKLHADLFARGNLMVLNKDCMTPYGTIFVTNGNRKHPHNNGIGLLVKINRINDNSLVEKRILLPGDNRYKYIRQQYLVDLDGLVASHHGGRYSGDKVLNPIQIPLNTRDGKIVYSYGRHAYFSPYNNSHKHPSQIQDYLSRGWVNALHTPNGDQILS